MLREYFWRRNFHLFECLMKDDDHGPKGVNPPIIPYVESRRAAVYYGSRKNGSYNHHNQIAKFKGEYYYSWSNGLRNEEDAGQQVLMAKSPDGLHWSDPWVVITSPPEDCVAHNCVALHATEDKLYQVVMTEETIHDATVTGMRRINPETIVMNVYASEDGRNWEQVSTFGNKIKWIFEAPRLTREGRLLCVCTTSKGIPAIMLWPGNDITEQPELIYVPEPEGASFPYGESTWYQTDEGRIMIFWRDEGASCRLYVNWSDDGGRTFSEPILTDIPDSMSRLYAGRLSDGRYFICNNTLGTLLDRSALMLLVSEDGYVFDKVYMVNDSPTEMRCKGLLKINGWQYPCCLVDGDKLLVAYDANKEDIYCEVIDTTKL
jgi:hypothetical protein